LTVAYLCGNDDNENNTNNDDVNDDDDDDDYDDDDGDDDDTLVGRTAMLSKNDKRLPLMVVSFLEVA